MRGTRTRVRSIALFVVALSLPILAARPGSARILPDLQSLDSGPAAHYDTSPALRDIPPAPAQEPRALEPHAERMPQRQGGDALEPVDELVQPNGPTRLAPTPSSNFDGVGNGLTGPQGTFTVSSAPPDTNSAVGPNHVVEIVNAGFAVFNKSGTVLYGPVQSNTLWSGFGGLCQTTNDGDGVVRYDAAADRWIISQFAVSGATTTFYECLAVSTTADPTGSYYRYAFSYSNFPDYPKLSVWPDAYYVTYNLFNAAGTAFLGSEACALDRSKMLTGVAATQQCFTTSTSYGGLLPSDLDGTTAPPAGAPNTIVAIGTTTTTLAYWKFHVDWTTPTNSTFSGPTNLTVATYAQACSGGTCIPQSGTTNKLDSLADRLMFRLAYRNFGDHESLVVSHSVTSGSVAAVRWYELRMSGGNPTVYQQGTYQPDSSFRWMPSIAMDKSGNIATAYSVSSSTLKPGIRYTGRLAGDALGSMTQGEGTFITGAGAQTGTLARWGDYSSMSVDPDGCRFWYSTEYIPADGTFNWKTRIGAFSFPSCGTNDFSIAASPTSGSVTAGGSTTATISTTLTSGSAQTINLSASGLPSGATASFSPSSVSSGGSSTMTISTTSATAPGSYAVTVTGTGTSATHTTSYTLTVNGSSSGVANGGFETGTFSGWTTSGVTSITTTTPRTGTYAGQGGSTAATNGDSSIVQTFTAPTGTTGLSFWYSMTCPDTVTYDWATATLRDNTTATTTTPLAKTCSTATYAQVSAAITEGHSYTLTMTSHDDNYATDASYTKFDDVALTAPPVNPVANPGFELGTLSGWTSAGTTSVTTSTPHTGSYAGQDGSTAPTNGDSSVSQTFTVPTGATTLSFWYSMTCPDTVTYDWATATLKNNTTATTTTPLAKTCATNAWTKVSVAVTAGQNYTLTLISHDDNYTSDASFTKYDDIVVS